MSVNAPKGSVQNSRQVSRVSAGNNVNSSNNQILMGETVLTTVYPQKSQVPPQNPNASLQSYQNSRSLQNASNVSQNQNLSTLSKNIKPSAVQSVHPSALPQQSVHNPSAFPQQSVHNPSVYPQQSVPNPRAHPQLSVVNPSAFPQQSVYNPSVHPPQSVHNPSAFPQQSQHSVHNPSSFPQQSQKFADNIRTFPQQSVHNPSSFPQQSQQSVHNPSAFPQQSVHNPSMQQSAHPQNQSIHSQISQNSQQIRGSGTAPPNQSMQTINSQMSNKPNESRLSRKSTLKASRNKSPPQVVRSTDGKLRRTNTDSSGNSYFVQDEQGKEATEDTIKSHLNDYLKKEIVNTISKEAKPESHKKGNGYRYYGQITKAGRNQNGKEKIDQDTPLVHLNVGGVPGFNLFGVLDGHGSQGHFVSQYCRDYFIEVMNKYAERCKSSNLNTPEAIYNELKRTKFAYIIDAFNKADVAMAQQKFDYNFSGTTCNIVFQFNKNLVCASVGDSRGILVFDQGDKKNQGIFPLSTDHKPNLPGEIDRIKLHGGVVEQMTDFEGNKVGPERVWKAGCNYPGLAMSRSLGDFQAKEAGVISSPQIVEYIITRASKYMIICSDGVWEFIKNEQVRDMGNAFFMKNDVGGFCTDLVKFAMHSWEQFDIIRDDITVVCVFF
jgi:serine/threonine protein phosphatase PrpC